MVLNGSRPDPDDTPNRPQSPQLESRDSFLSRVRDWYERHATPRRDDDLWSVPAYVDAARARDYFEGCRRWQATLFEHGLTGLSWLRAYGGVGAPAWQARIHAEIASGYEESPGFLGATIAMLGPTLLRHGSEDQKRHFLPRLLSGEYAFCQLFSEPGAGSDLASLAMRAEQDGDAFVLTGQKVWNSQAQFCNWGFALVRTDPDAPKHHGITFLLVDMSTRGIEARPLVQMNGAAHFNEVFFDAVRVPAANVVGEVNRGWAPARTVLLNESAFIGDGTRRGALESLTELARLNGRSDDDLIRHRLADIWAREHVGQWMGTTIQRAVRRGERPPIDPALMKLFAAESKRRSSQLAAEIGAMSVVADLGAPSRWARHELMSRFAVSIGGGTNEVMRNNLSERALGLPREPRLPRETPWRDIPR